MFGNSSEEELQAAIQKNLKASRVTIQNPDDDIEECKKWASCLVSQAKGLEKMFEVAAMRDLGGKLRGLGVRTLAQLCGRVR